MKSVFLLLSPSAAAAALCPQLSLAVRWLLARVPPALRLSCQTLAQLVESTLSREFTARVFAHQQERAAARLPPAGPEPVVQLYNGVVAHVAERVTLPELVGISWPPCEFWRPETSGSVPHLGWNSARHLDWLRRAILSLQLPPWTQPSGSGQCRTLESMLIKWRARVKALLYIVKISVKLILIQKYVLTLRASSFKTCKLCVPAS